MTKYEAILTGVLAVAITGAIAAVFITMIVQSQMTERIKFEKGYEQQVEQVESRLLTSPMWRKK